MGIDQELITRNAQLALLAAISQKLVLAPNTDTAVLADVFEELANELRFELYFHYQLDGPQTLRLAASQGLSAAQQAQFARVRFGQYLCGLVAKRRESLIVEDLGALDYPEAAELQAVGVSCYAGVPLIAHGRLLGTVSFATLGRGCLGPGELQLIQTVCDQAAALLARSRAEQRLRYREAHLQLAMEAALAMSFMWDVRHDRVVRLAGMDGALPSTGETTETLDDFLGFVHAADRDRVRTAIAEAMRRPDGAYGVEYRVARDAGQFRWLSDRGRMEFDRHGEPLRLVGIVQDMTERKEAEERLRVSEARLRVATDAAAMFSWQSDLVSGTVTWSDNAARLIGCRPDELPTRLEEAMFFVHPEDAQRMTAEFAALLERGGTRYTREFRGRDPDRLRYWQGLCTVLYAEGGRPTEFVGVTQDVTERKLAEMALRASEDSFRNVFEHSPIGIAITEIDGRFVRFNTAYAEIVGYPRDALLTMTFGELVHPADRDSNLHGIRRLLDGEVPVLEIENRYLRRNGEAVWVQKVVSTLRDENGRMQALVGLVTDITERRRAERNLQFLADLTSSFAPLASSCDIANLAAEKIARHFEVARVNFSDVRGGDLAMVYGGRHDPELADDRGLHRLRDYFDAPLLDLLRDGEAVAIDDVAVHRHTRCHAAAYRAWNVGSLALAPYSSEGRWKFLLVLHKTHPCRWRVDELDLLREVAVRVHLRIERARAEEALHVQDQRKNEFLATLAHELRNPLAPVRNAAQILKLKAPPVPELQWAREVIDRQVRQMTRLIDDLLDVSRVSCGKLELRREAVDLVKIVQDAVETSRPLIEKSTHRMTITVPAQGLIVDADATRLTQVVANLLDNAAKYTDAGGHIELSVERDGDEAVVVVRDNGVGIPTDKLDAIFEMFSQVDDALNRSHGGLGIGLSLVKRLVDMHGGNITAHSAGRGAGSTFSMRLPLATPTRRPSEPVRHDDTMGGASSLTILVVDDNPDAAASTTLLLKLMGNRVRVANDGEEAIAVARECQPDVILLDIGLPKLNGYDVCRRLRTEAWAAGTTIIAVTGWGQAEDRRRTQAAGFDHHLVKPVDPAALLSLLAPLTASESVSGEQ